MSLHLFSLSASSAWVFAAVFLTMVLAGVVKGTVGFGLPLISVSVLANVIDVRLALALVTIPIVISNLWLAWQGREVVATLRRFWLVILAIGVGIFLGSSLTARVDGRSLMLILGCTVIVFALFEKFRPGEHASLPPALVTPLGAVAGLTGGILGGLSTAYGPPLIMYLTTLRMPKERFVAAVGTIWFFASIFLVGAFSTVKILTPHSALLSALSVVPVYLGLRIGEVLRGRIDQQRFQTLTLIVLVVLGLNLLRRALL